MEKVFGIVFEAEERFGGDAEEYSVAFSPITQGAEKGEGEAEEAEGESAMTAEPVHFGVERIGKKIAVGDVGGKGILGVEGWSERLSGEGGLLSGSGFVFKVARVRRDG